MLTAATMGKPKPRRNRNHVVRALISNPKRGSSRHKNRKAYTRKPKHNAQLTHQPMKE